MSTYIHKLKLSIKYFDLNITATSHAEKVSMFTRQFLRRVPLAFILILPGIHANHTEKLGVPLVMYGG